MKVNFSNIYKAIFLLFVCLCWAASCIADKEKRDFICNSDYVEVFKEYKYDEINEEWVKEDIKLYEAIAKISKANPLRMDSLITSENASKVNLGNGYVSKVGSFGKGYLTVYFNYVLYNDSLQGYELKIPLKDILLLEKFGYHPKELFSENLFYNSNKKEYVFHHGLDTLSTPHNLSQEKEVSPLMKFYMTPFSGVKYGCRGGYGNGILKNRCCFKQLESQQKLLASDLIYLMHSVNLATRLTSIEYYTRNVANFSQEERAAIENVVYNVFQDFGDKKISILLGDIGHHLTIEDAINLNLKEDCL